MHGGNVSKRTGSQQETAIAINRTNPNQIAVSSNSLTGLGTRNTTNGGSTWSTSHLIVTAGGYGAWKAADSRHWAPTPVFDPGEPGLRQLRLKLPPDLRPRVGQAMADVFDKAAPQRLEYTIPNPAGEPRAYVASIMPIMRDGAVARAVLTALDISEQKAAELAIRELNSSLEAGVQDRTSQLQLAMEKAESASRAKREFLSRMSHELRTPMNAILGFAQIIEMSDPAPQQLKWAGEIRRAGDHLLQMIEELLDLARIEVGKMAINTEALDLLPLINGCLAIVQPLTAARGLEVTLDCPAANAWALADRLRLRQVLVVRSAKPVT